MSDQDYEHDAEHLDWQLDDEQSSNSDDAPSNEDTSNEDSSVDHANEQAEKGPQEPGSKQGGDDYRSDGERVNSLVPASEMLPERIYLLPIHNRPFFPAQVQPLVINRERWEETMRRVGNTPHHTLGVAFVGEQGVTSLDHEGFPEIGTAVKVHKLKGEDDQIQFIAQGLQRFKITRWLSKEPPYLVEVTYPKEPVDAENEETRAYAMAIINGIKELLPINPLYGEELKHYLNRFSPHQPGPLTDFAAAITSAKGPELQDVLATLSVEERMQKVLPLLRKASR